MNNDQHQVVRNEAIRNALSKLESQIARNPDLPPIYRSILKDALAALDAQPAACQHEYHWFGDQVKSRRCLHCNKLESAQPASRDEIISLGKVLAQVDIPTNVRDFSSDTSKAEATNEAVEKWSKVLPELNGLSPARAIDRLAFQVFNSKAEASSDAAKHAWWLKQIANLDPRTGSIGTAVFMAKEALAAPSAVPAQQEIEDLRQAIKSLARVERQKTLRIKQLEEALSQDAAQRNAEPSFDEWFRNTAFPAYVRSTKEQMRISWDAAIRALAGTPAPAAGGQEGTSSSC